MKEISPLIFVFAKEGLLVVSNHDAGVARARVSIVFQELRPGDGFKTGDFVQEELGGGYH